MSDLGWIREHSGLPVGKLFAGGGGAVFMHPWTALGMRYANGRDPLYTRHMEGVRELERDRRRHGR